MRVEITELAYGSTLKLELLRSCILTFSIRLVVYEGGVAPWNIKLQYTPRTYERTNVFYRVGSDTSATCIRLCKTYTMMPTRIWAM